MRKEVYIGEVEVTQMREDVLTASGIGSCAVIALYDTVKRNGALAHAMLPSRGDGAKYVDTAIDMMLAKLVEIGTKKSDLQAKLVGGANLFHNIHSDIGDANVASARKKLKRENILLVGEAVGGTQGRSVEFVIATGIVSIIIKF